MTIRAEGKWQGMNWIRQEKRLAIYLRDGCACAWCGSSVEEGTQLTLDHLIPHVKGGSNHHSNLVTSCMRCNQSRGTRSMAAFAKAVTIYVGKDSFHTNAILRHLNNTRARSIVPYLVEAKELIARRGSAYAALQQRAAVVV